MHKRWIDFPWRIDDPIPQMHDTVFNCGPYSEEGVVPFGDVGNEIYPTLDATIQETALNPPDVQFAVWRAIGNNKVLIFGLECGWK